MAKVHRPQAGWVTALKAVLVFILFLLALLGFIVLFSATGSWRPLLLVAIVALALGALWVGLARLLRRHQPGRPPFWRAWLGASGVWSLALLALLGLPLLAVIWINTTRPLAVPRVTLSDGQKEVVFQGMIHIGSEAYYQAIIFDMTRAADLNYVLLFEGVRPGSAANVTRLNELLGTQGTNLNQVYDAFAQQCGLRFQNEYFGVFGDDLADSPGQFVNADVSIDDMMAEWDRLLAEHPEWAAAQPAATPEEQVDTQLDGFMGQLNAMTPGQRRLTEMACHTYLNVAFSRLGGAKPPFNEQVVLDYRNRNLAQAILQQPAARLYVTYGFDHFRGVYRLLQEANPDWQIVDVAWRQAIDSTTEIERELQLAE